MLEIYFEIKKEAKTFCERLLIYNPNLDLEWKRKNQWGYRLIVRNKSHDVSNQKQKEYIARALSDVFVFHNEMYWIYNVIKKKYFFKNKEEIQRIADITQSIVAGEDTDLAQVIKANKPRDSLLNIFRSNLDENIIHFQSILNFRMHKFKNELIEVIGLAIDEVKREEEYQSFIQSLREYVSRKKIENSVIHVLQGDNFSFFKEDGDQYSTVEIKLLIKKEPVYIVGLDHNELNLTPLLAMAPEKIYIYGDDPLEPKTLTILNIFEERVKFLPAKAFPFDKSFYTS